MSLKPSSFGLCVYTAGILLLSVETNIPHPYLFPLCVSLAGLVLLIRGTRKEPKEEQKKLWLYELIYCVIVYALTRLLSPLLGNIITSILILAACWYFVKKILKEETC